MDWPRIDVCSTAASLLKGARCAAYAVETGSKGTRYDIVRINHGIMKGPVMRLHHFGYITSVDRFINTVMYETCVFTSLRFLGKFEASGPHFLRWLCLQGVHCWCESYCTDLHNMAAALRN